MKNRRCQPVCHEHTKAWHRHSAARRDQLSRASLVWPHHFPSKSRRLRGLRIPCPCPGTRFQTGTHPSALSSFSGLSSCAPVPPGAHGEAGRDCLAANTVSLPRAFYSGHTPPLRALKHQGVATPAPDTTPAPAEVPALAMVFVRWVTSVEGVSPRACCWVVKAPASTPFADDAERRPISGDRNQKLPRTRQQRSFPFRFRLPSISPARAFAPW